MSEEEKETIEELKRTIKNSNFCDSIGIGQIETLLNYIDKLQKENEELTKRLEHLCKSDTICSYDEVDTKGNYKKDISTLDKQNKAIDVMSELLCSIYLVDELGQASWNWDKEQMKEYFYKKVEEEYE